MSSNKLSERAARRRRNVYRAGGDRQVAYAVVAADGHTGGRNWINGEEVGGTDARYMHLEHTSD